MEKFLTRTSICTAFSPKQFGLVALLFLLAAPAFSQNKLADKANEAFKLLQYAEAATLYEQALAGAKPSKSTGAMRAKLAWCYRMNNRMDKAEPLYAELSAAENAKPETLFYYGEALMSNGKYGDAKEAFLAYRQLEPEDANTALMLEACDKAPLIQPYFQYVDIQAFAQNSDADDNSPMPWQNGLVFSSDRPSGLKLMKEKSGWTGRDYLDLYFSEQLPDGSYGKPAQFSAKLSELNKNTGNASFTKDGSEVFFTRNDNSVNQHDTYNLQLFSAQSAGGGRWKDVEKLPFCAPAFNFMHPAVSPDGKTLFFASSKAGGYGGVDLWMSRRNGSGEWLKPENLGERINTLANEGFPFVDADGKLYFCSKGHPGFGGFDIFVTQQDENGHWAAPVNLGKPLNSSLDDVSIFIAPDRSGGLFTSSRSGGDDDIYFFTVISEAPPLTENVPTEQAETTLAEQSVIPVGGPTNNPPTTPESTVSEPFEPPLHEEKVEAVLIKEVEPVKVEEPKVEPVQAPKLEEKKEPALPAATPKVEPAQEPALKEKKEDPKTKADKPQQPPTLPASRRPGQTPAPALPDSSGRQSSAKVETPVLPLEAAEPPPSPSPSEPVAVAEHPVMAALPSFKDLEWHIDNGNLQLGNRYRLDGAIFDPNIWQLTPRVAQMLDRLADILRRHPSLVVEIGAHTEALGVDEHNLNLSENRAKLAVEYLIREGIAAERLSAKGYGETLPLNGCVNGVTCGMDEHRVNQRLEVMVVKM